MPKGKYMKHCNLYEKKVGELHNSVYDQLEDEIIHRI